MPQPYTGYPFVAEQNENATGIAQREIVIAATPAGMESVIGKTLVDAGQLATAGDYYVIVPTAGIVALEVHLTATFASSATSAGSKSLHTIRPANTPPTMAAILTAYGYQALTGIGALVTATKQSITVTLKGEKYVMLKLTLGTNVTFTQGEMNGV